MSDTDNFGDSFNEPNVFGDDEEADYDPETSCVECGKESMDQCVCGNPLCHMHFEIQGGFCEQTSDEEHDKLMKNIHGETHE